MPLKRSHRPRPVERALRQEAGYGCCRCGHPILQYHHICPYTEHDPHYRLGDMMVLCPNCHDMATRKVLSEAEQRELKAAPFNIRNGFAKGQLTVKQGETRIHVGESVAMIASGSLVGIDGESLLGLSLGPEGDLRLSAALYDREDNLLAKIVENVWETGDSFPWDLDADYQRLTIRKERGDIALELDLRAEVPVIKGHMWRNGRGITLGNDGIRSETGGGIHNLTLDGGAIQFNSHDQSFNLGPPKSLPRTKEETPGRNDPCWCGSGAKFKKCHGR